MIDLTESEDQLLKPAESLQELYDRFDQRVGSVVSIIRPASSSNYEVQLKGILDGVSLTNISKKSQVFRVYLRSQDGIQLGLESTLSVNIDGVWKLIHEPSPSKELTR